MTTPAANAPGAVFNEMVKRVTDDSIDEVLGLVVDQCIALLKSTRKIEAAVLHSYVDATAAAALIENGSYVPPAPTPTPSTPSMMPSLPPQ
jgi:hypothetical protein